MFNDCIEVLDQSGSSCTLLLLSTVCAPHVSHVQTWERKSGTGDSSLPDGITVGVGGGSGDLGELPRPVFEMRSQSLDCSPDPRIKSDIKSNDTHIHPSGRRALPRIARSSSSYVLCRGDSSRGSSKPISRRSTDPGFFSAKPSRRLTQQRNAYHWESSLATKLLRRGQTSEVVWLDRWRTAI